jgi:CHAT domain-containing protein
MKILLLLTAIALLMIVPASLAGEPPAAGFAAGLQLLESGQYDKAVALFLAQAEQFAGRDLPSAQAEALLYAGQANLQAGRYAQADAQLSQAAQLARQAAARLVLAKSLNLLGSLAIGAPYSQADAGRTGGVRGHSGVAPDKGGGYLAEALALAKELADPRLAASVLNNQGSLYAGRHDFTAARNMFLEALAATRNSADEPRAAALVNLAALCGDYGEYAEAEKYARQAYELLAGFPPSAAKLSALIKTGNAFGKVAGNLPTMAMEAAEGAHRAFRSALTCAEALRDAKGRGYALGYDGQVYERAGELANAFDLTRKALFAAQLADSHEQLALWQWQMARLHGASKHEEAALAAYKRALAELQQLKQSAPSQCRECEISFKEFIEPVYKGLIGRMFAKADSAEPAALQSALAEIRDSIEAFRTAELQDFFKDACVAARPGATQAFKSPPATALIYYSILPKKLEIVAQFPSGFKRYSVAIDARLLAKEIALFRSSLSLNFDNYLGAAKRLYDVMLLPLRQDLAAAKIDTLVIVPDGPLRSIPLAALHDGKEFVVANFAVAVTQGVQLTDTSPVSADFKGILMAGISEGRFDFPPLPGVPVELAGISGIYGGTALMNGEFGIEALKSSIEKKPYSIIHLATHGEFAGDIDNMFILAYDGIVTFDQLERLVKVTKYKDTPLELLTLSACKTASGDDRAALGLAGIAVKAGAKSTMAALWEIDDRATSELIVDFYRRLKTAEISKSQALRQAQLKLMKQYPHPYYWSPFLLVGNWL